MKINKKFLKLIGIIAIIPLFTIVLLKESQSSVCNPQIIDYAAAPPFISDAIPPNILLVLDASGSMQFPSYLPCSFGGYSSKRALCGTSSDPSYNYDFNKTYYGYFKTDKYYEYGSNKFFENIVCAYNDKIGGPDCISGNLLNWATMTRNDLLRKALIGGKSVSQQGNAHTLRGEGGWWTFSDDNLQCTFDLSGGSYPNLNHVLTISNYLGSCQLGTLSNANTKVDVPEAEKIGIIQRLSDKDNDGNWDTNAPRFGLMMFNRDNRDGKMLVGIAQQSMSSFLTELQNISPYHGTPTGEALREAYDYFTQTHTYPYELNNSHIGGPGSTKDPWYTSGSPVECRKSFVLLISDGEWNGNVDPVRPARENYIVDIRPTIPEFQSIITYSVFIFGSTGAGRNSMQQTALFGGFYDFDTNTWPYNRTDYPVNSRNEILPAAPCLAGSIDSGCKEWDKDSDGIPENYFEAAEGTELETQLINAISSMLQRTSSGTAVSVLATAGSGEGAVYQAYFYPSTQEGLTEVKWTGYLQALFVDSAGNLREDTDGDQILNQTTDFIIKMRWDDVNKKVLVDRYEDLYGDGRYDIDTNGDLVNDSYTLYDTIFLDETQPIWEAGKLLWKRAHTDRRIFTSLDGYSFTGLSVDPTKGTYHTDTGNDAILRPYLNAATVSEAVDIINYIRGDDSNAAYRSRTITITGEGANPWKLGDIVYSTPSSVAGPRENYDFLFGDSTYAAFKSKYANRRQVVYTGANDGMLHAFNAGFFRKRPIDNLGEFCLGGDTDLDGRISDGECISNPLNVDLGEEIWAFIPTDLLPHLKWLTDPDYPHVYYVDLKPKIVDARIFAYNFTNPLGKHPYGWGTILIGGMRYGGKEICVTDDFGSGPETKTFRSSYFAIDITDPLNPELLWTFNNADLGFTSSFPSVVRIRTDPSKSHSKDPGEWFVVFGSGPTNYDGTSTQTSRIFTLKISDTLNNDGVISTWTDTPGSGNYTMFATGDNSAFMADSIAVDVNRDYTHDVVYIGNAYYQATNWKGKMFRLVTKNSTDLSTWALSTLYDAGNKPITSSASAALDTKGNLLVFFGTGRYLDRSDANLTDQQTFYGIKDTCKPWLNYNCITPIVSTDLYDATNVDVCIGGADTTCSPNANTWTNIITLAGAKDGWFVDFPLTTEKNIVKPLVLGGLVVWATYVPNTDICKIEGESFVYAAYYETGTAYFKWVFVEEKYSTQPDTVGRRKVLGVGAPASIVGMVTKSGTFKGFAQTDTGAILEVEFDSPIPTYGYQGWGGRQMIP